MASFCMTSSLFDEHNIGVSARLVKPLRHIFPPRLTRRVVPAAIPLPHADLPLSPVQHTASSGRLPVGMLSLRLSRVSAGAPGEEADRSSRLPSQGKSSASRPDEAHDPHREVRDECGAETLRATGEALPALRPCHAVRGRPEISTTSAPGHSAAGTATTTSSSPMPNAIRGRETR